jgi:hypothetical protein
MCQCDGNLRDCVDRSYHTIVPQGAGGRRQTAPQTRLCKPNSNRNSNSNESGEQLLRTGTLGIMTGKSRRKKKHKKTCNAQEGTWGRCY